MAVTLQEPTPVQIIEKIGQMLKLNMSNPGIVAAVGEYLPDNSRAIRELHSQDIDKVLGTVVSWARLTTVVSEEDWFEYELHTVRIMRFRSYRGELSEEEGLASSLLLAQDAAEIAQILREDMELGFGEDVEHLGLQVPQDVTADSDQVLGAYMALNCELVVRVKRFRNEC